MLQDGQDEVVLGREVDVERRLGDLGLGDDAVDADGPEALLVEQPVGRLEDALPGFGSGLRPFHARIIQTGLSDFKSWRLLSDDLCQEQRE